MTAQRRPLTGAPPLPTRRSRDARFYLGRCHSSIDPSFLRLHWVVFPHTDSPAQVTVLSATALRETWPADVGRETRETMASQTDRGYTCETPPSRHASNVYARATAPCGRDPGAPAFSNSRPGIITCPPHQATRSVMCHAAFPSWRVPMQHGKRPRMPLGGGATLTGARRRYW